MGGGLITKIIKIKMLLSTKYVERLVRRIDRRLRNKGVGDTPEAYAAIEKVVKEISWCYSKFGEKKDAFSLKEIADWIQKDEMEKAIGLCPSYCRFMACFLDCLLLKIRSKNTGDFHAKIFA